MPSSRSPVFPLLAGVCVLVIGFCVFMALQRPHNVIIFVADGLRSVSVTDETAPTMAQIRREGVDFRNSHSMYPTVTTPNASAIATGHRLGDTGDFANTMFPGEPALPSAAPNLVPTFEDDAVLGDMNARYGGNYLNETTLLAAARARGFSTAAIGKLGPTAIQDVTSRDGKGSIVIDDDTGTPDGFPLPADVVGEIKALGLDAATPDRALNSDPGDYIRSGVHVANVEQQNWFAAVAAEVLLPRFKAANKPFVLVFWSRDPDGTQHNEGDSLNSLTPGINGPTSRAAIRNADNDLARLREALRKLGLDKTTDIVVTADHGFSTAAKQSATSGAARLTYKDVPKGFLPPGFLAIDLSKALGLPLHESNGLDVDLAGGFRPRAGSLLGDVAHPSVVIAPNGGSDQIWLPGPDAKALAPRIVAALVAEDYTGGVFVDDRLGRIPGTLALSQISLVGSARTPRPAVVVTFRSFATGCANPELCGAEIADTDLQQGQGIHGSFGRADTHNFMAAIGPDFRKGFVDPTPVSNADWAVTLSKILKLNRPSVGALAGRGMSESLKGGAAVASSRREVRSAPAANGFVTVLDMQEAGGVPYYDTAGAPGRTLGAWR
jgi:hypothetical protein